MRVIIAGSRGITDQKTVNAAIKMGLEHFDLTEVVSGGAKGVDQAGEKWAYAFKFRVKTFPANWKRYGRSAGPVRNKEMAQYADALIAIWDGKSRGTKHMIKEMEKLKKPMLIIHVVPAAGKGVLAGAGFYAIIKDYLKQEESAQ